MKKKALLMVLVMLIALVATTPALARYAPTFFTTGGTVTSVEPGFITVQTKLGREVTVQVTADTVYLRWTVDGFEEITFADIAAGVSVNIKGTVDGAVYTAERVAIDVPLYCAE